MHANIPTYECTKMCETFSLLLLYGILVVVGVWGYILKLFFSRTKKFIIDTFI